MRVAIDVTPLLGARTGVGDFVAGLLSSLPDPETTVRGFALSVRMREQLAREMPHEMRVWPLPFPARLARACWLRTNWPPAELVAGPSDVVHGTNFVCPPARRGSEIVTVHDLSFVHFPQFSEAPTIDFRRLLLAASRRGAMFHTHTEFVAGEISEWLGLDLERIIAIPGGIPDIEAIESASPEAGRRLAQSDPYVLALGTEDPRKGLPTLIDAFDEVAREIPDVTLVLSGPRGWGSDAVEESIRKSNCGQRIRRLGWVARDQRNSLLTGASVLAYPSIYEGFGYPPLQALAAGVPVVATEIGPLKEVLGAAARLVPRGDAKALAEALHLELTGRSSTTVDSRREHASKFTWAGLAEGLRTIYREMRQKKAR